MIVKERAPGMLQSMGLQRVGHDLATEQQQRNGSFHASPMTSSNEILSPRNLEPSLLWPNPPKICLLRDLYPGP